MGTNYYMVSKDKNFAEKYFPDQYDITDWPYFCYKIHLNKCSSGWKTLFCSHESAYRSVKELKSFISRHEGIYEIYDEYGENISLEAYENEVLDRDGKIKKIPLCWKPDEVFGGMSLFPCAEGEEPVLFTPIDHAEYEAARREHGDFPFIESHYTKDEEGNNFLAGEFC